MKNFLQTVSQGFKIEYTPESKSFVLSVASESGKTLVTHELKRAELQVLMIELERALEASYGVASPPPTKQGDCGWCGQGVLDSDLFEHYRTTDNDIVLLHSACTERFKQFEFKFR